MSLAVMAGAAGSHMLKSRLDAKAMETFGTAQTFQVVHSLALILLAIYLTKVNQSRLATASGWLFIVGLLFFVVPLYLIALAGFKMGGAIAPLGGLSWIVAWAIWGVDWLKPSNGLERPLVTKESDISS